MSYKFQGNTVICDLPKKPKKLTATRFATVLGLNVWSTPFEAWCEITRTYAKPFEDTKYTIAGKTIEPKQIDYMKKAYAMDNIKTPTDIYGNDYFKKTWGDFFPQDKVFGGMWDSILYDDDGKPCLVLEFKTTKRAEDWSKDIPEYYALQAALYAHLLGVEDVVMVASFLEESDYENPDNYVPSAANTITIEFSLYERYPHFQSHIDRALEWWEKHIMTGVSPEFDEKKDAEILKELRKNTVSVNDDIKPIVSELEQLKFEYDSRYTNNGLAVIEKRIKELNDNIKNICSDKFRTGDTKVEVIGSKYIFTLSRSVTSEIDKKALKKDGLLDKYNVPKETLRFSTKLMEGS